MRSVLAGSTSQVSGDVQSNHEPSSTEHRNRTPGWSSTQFALLVVVEVGSAGTDVRTGASTVVPGAMRVIPSSASRTATKTTNSPRAACLAVIGVFTWSSAVRTVSSAAFMAPGQAERGGPGVQSAPTPPGSQLAT